MGKEIVLRDPQINNSSLVIIDDFHHVIWHDLIWMPNVTIYQRVIQLLVPPIESSHDMNDQAV